MLKAISLYTGVGGLDFGFEAAGIKTAVAVEMDKAACDVVGRNRRWPLLSGDIHEITSKEILQTAGLRKGQADVLIGGPPCQPFSKSSYWVSGASLGLDDPRADTLAAYLRVLRDAKPRAFLLENVHGMAYSKKSEGLDFLLKGIEEVNRDAKTRYTVRWAVLNSADYGVPQARERVFLVGSRDGTPFQFPTPTHASAPEAQLLDAGLEPYRTAWDAIGDLDGVEPEENGLVVGGRWGDLLPSIPEGENYLWHTNRRDGMRLFGWRTRYWSFLLKLSKRRPSWTIQARPGPHIGPFHWRNRRLTAAEMCRIQTFPDGLDFNRSRNDVQRMLGNAVPSLLAEVLACEIRRQLLKSPRRQKKLRLIPPHRTPVPKQERVRRVPKKYWDLAADHPDHPGEGRGRRARRWADEERQTTLF